MSAEISVIDYGLGNIRSVAKALESAGARVIVTNKPGEISNSSGVVFPGVGAFGRGMENVNKLGLLTPLIKDMSKDGLMKSSQTWTNYVNGLKKRKNIKRLFLQPMMEILLMFGRNLMKKIFMLI